ncbi:hypothetical protein OH76DRAFT_1486975 [Lentinus brumalis]|uniref:Protein Zds1 C-terminal domain-containing protein n=1 Tax=Lentinus brumalis TaxID=2498619 RepID=A0A371CW68_9APHY|nr:hypothetical protein OH76DRAFT_1486975 [Polyporus brumalis]
MSFASIHPAYDVYARELWSLGHGHAMWGPEPSPAFGEVRLGDVGYLREGHFSFLLNCMCDAHDPVNKRGVPDDFEVFAPPDANSIQHCPDKITQSELHSKSIRSLDVSVGASASGSIAAAAAAATLRYQCTQTSGALLLLKEHAHKWLLDCDRPIKAYMCTHIEQWHQFATLRLGIDVKQEDIIFVSGCTKTSVWAEAAFHGTSSQGELVVSGGWPMPAVAGEFRVSLSRSADASVFSRIGPSHRVKKEKDTDNLGAEAAPADQCIFLNYHKAKQRRRWRPPKVMMAAAGPHNPGSGSDDNDSFASMVSTCPAASGTSSNLISTLSGESSYNGFSPVDSLIDYILLNSDAETACVSDTDLTSIFPGDDLPEKLLGALEVLRVPVFTVHIPDGVASIVMGSPGFRSMHKVDLLTLREVNQSSMLHECSSAASVDSPEGTLVNLELPEWPIGSKPKVAPFWVKSALATDGVHLDPELPPKEFKEFLQERSRTALDDAQAAAPGRGNSVGYSGLARKRSMLSRQYTPSADDGVGEEEEQGRDAAAALVSDTSRSSTNYVPPPPPPPSLYSRYPIHVERAIYRLGHIKLAEPRRPLYQQVLISNLMFWYLSVIDNTGQNDEGQEEGQNAAAASSAQAGAAGQEQAEKDRRRQESAHVQDRADIAAVWPTPHKVGCSDVDGAPSTIARKGWSGISTGLLYQDEDEDGTNDQALSAVGDPAVNSFFMNLYADADDDDMTEGY